MANDKPQIAVTLKVRGMTIEDMTVQEARELRDVLNTIVGEKESAPYPVYPVYPVYPWYRTVAGTWTVTCNTSNAPQRLSGNTANGLQMYSDNAQHYTISCN